MKSRLQEKYRNETVPALMKHFGWKNVMAVPKLQKVTLNIGLGEASQTAKLLDTAAVELGQISGQKPVITRAKKSIANFKIRKGMPIGCAVTLRGDKMYEFIDRLCNVVLPRVRDFRGLPSNAFDGRGNYTLGLRDQLQIPLIGGLHLHPPAGDSRRIRLAVDEPLQLIGPAPEVFGELAMTLGPGGMLQGGDAVTRPHPEGERRSEERCQRRHEQEGTESETGHGHLGVGGSSSTGIHSRRAASAYLMASS